MKINVADINYTHINVTPCFDSRYALQYFVVYDDSKTSLFNAVKNIL